MRIHALARSDRSKPTITDIAEALGVSRATVSRAFGRPEQIGEATVKRVHQMAEQLGYVANPLARALSTGKQGNVAILVPDIANPFFPPLIRAMQRSADEAGYGVFIGDTDSDPQREFQLAMRLAPQIEGFVLASSRMSDPDILRVATMCPVVMINRDIKTLPRILIDPTTGLEEAVAALVDLGHRQIAYVAGPVTSWSDQQRRAVLRATAKRHGLTIRVLDGFKDSFEGGRAAAGALVGAGVTGAIAFDDFVAHGILAGLAQAGLAVPQSFSLIGFDDVLGASTWPALSSVHAPGDEAGRRAMAVLTAALKSGESEPVCDRLGTRFVARATIGPKPQV